MKRLIAAALAAAVLTGSACGMEYTFETDDGCLDAALFQDAAEAVGPADISISAPSAILMEKETGTVIFEKNPDERLEPASVTKVMTILLIVEAVEAGTISMDDTVTASAYAASMGGSQIFLEEGEQMSVRDMLKSIVVSSANDAAVAMAEHLAGTEEAFVQRMNARAAELGMENTNFCNCTGLLSQPEHLTTARDIAIMSRELIRHDMIKEFTTIWMDTVRGGEFGLSNTNKLIYYYDGATGLKTGFTSSAGYCLSATAQRDGVEYIAVIMHADSSQNRFESAKTLLSYAFANYTLTSSMPDDALAPIAVNMGEYNSVQPVVQGGGSMLVEKSRVNEITKTVEISGVLEAPVEEGQRLGSVTVSDSRGELAVLPIVASSKVVRLTWGQVFLKLLKLTFTGDL